MDGIVRIFASEVGLDPSIGGADNVQDAIAGIPTGGFTVVRHPFDHTQHAALAAGVLVATLPDGAVVFERGMLWSIVTAFNGTTPAGAVATTQADAVALSNLLPLSADPTVPNSAVANNTFAASASSTDGIVAVGGTIPIWLAITDGASGDPGSTAGEGELVFAYIV